MFSRPGAAAVVIALAAVRRPAARRRRRRPPAICSSSPSTRCAPITSAPTARRPARHRRSTRWPRAACASIRRRPPFRSPGRRTRRSSPASYPPAHGVRGNVVFTLGDETSDARDALEAARLSTAAFVGAYPVAAAFGFNQGFDTFDEEFHETSPIDQGAERRANEVADAALRWLGATTRRARRSSRGCISTIRTRRIRRRRRTASGSPAVPTTARSPSPTRRWAACSTRCARPATIATPIVMVLADHGEGPRRSPRADARGAHLSVDDAGAVHRRRSGRRRRRASCRRASRPIDVVPTALALVGADADRVAARPRSRGR